MIANPTVPAFRYDPYSKKFTRETYEHNEMRSVRGDAVRVARRGLEEMGSGGWGVILGTLGRQGSLSVLNVRIYTVWLQRANEEQTIRDTLPPGAEAPLLLLLSELSPAKLALIPDSDITTFVQTSCPRLSIDWGYAFSRPLLSPYEASVALGRVRGWGGLEFEVKGKAIGERSKMTGEGDYPMDFYSVRLQHAQHGYGSLSDAG
jgi:2-(3-amino-3-carboxypropyl)histidine synthase